MPANNGERVIAGGDMVDPAGSGQVVAMSAPYTASVNIGALTVAGKTVNVAVPGVLAGDLVHIALAQGQSITLGLVINGTAICQTDGQVPVTVTTTVAVGLSLGNQSLTFV